MKIKALILIPMLLASAYVSAASAEHRLVVRIPAAGLKTPSVPVNPGVPPGTTDPVVPVVPEPPVSTDFLVSYNTAAALAKTATYVRAVGEVGEAVSARFVVKNTGDAAASFSPAMVATGSEASGYSLMENIPATNCKFKTSLQAAETCFLYVRYLISTAGTSGLTLSLYDMQMNLTSPAVAATLPDVVNKYWAVEPNFQDNREVAANGSPDYVAFYNQSAKYAMVKDIRVSGDYVIPANPERLPPMTRCALEVVFSNGQPCQVPVMLANPLRVGTHTGVLTVTYTNQAGNVSGTKTLPISATVN